MELPLPCEVGQLFHLLLGRGPTTLGVMGTTGFLCSLCRFPRMFNQSGGIIVIIVVVIIIIMIIIIIIFIVIISMFFLSWSNGLELSFDCHPDWFWSVVASQGCLFLCSPSDLWTSRGNLLKASIVWLPWRKIWRSHVLLPPSFFSAFGSWLILEKVVGNEGIEKVEKRKGNGALMHS